MYEKKILIPNQKKTILPSNNFVNTNPLLTYLNIFLIVLIIFGTFGTILLNLDIFSQYAAETSIHVHSAVFSLTNGFLIEKNQFLSLFSIRSKSHLLRNTTSFKTATSPQLTKSLIPTRELPTTQIPSIAITITPTSTPIPPLIVEKVRTSETPTPTQLPVIPVLPTSSPVITTTPIQTIQSNFVNKPESQNINFYKLGEAETFGKTMQFIPYYQLVSKNKDFYSSISIGAGNIKTVFLIILENSNWSNIIGNYTNAPYINQHILPQASYANNYYNPIGIHPSEPNYIWLEAGSNTHLDGRSFTTDDDPNVVNSTDDTMHFTTLLNEAHLSWKSYVENIDGTSCPTTSNGLFAPKHDPMLYFQDVTNNPNYCISHERPYPELSADLEKNTVANYNMIIPNLCDDGHDDCGPLHNKISQTDKWLSTTVPHILQSQAYKNGGLLLITWDEGEGISDTVTSDGPIGFIALSPYAKGNGYSNEIYYTHSSTLRTLEEIFGLPLLRDSAHANDLSDLFISNTLTFEYSYFSIQNAVSSPKLFANLPK